MRTCLLLTGKLTGNFTKFGPARRFSRQIRQQIQCVAEKFPTQRNREFLEPQPGIFRKEQGIFSSGGSDIATTSRAEAAHS